MFFTGPFGKARPEAAAQQQSNNPLAAAFRGAQGGQAGQGQGGPGARGGGVNPQVFQQLRTRFCTPEGVNLVPGPADVEGLPPPLLERLRNPDGTINPERWAEFRPQMCSGGGPGMDPQRLAQLREQFCGQPGQEPPPITDEQLAALPPQMLERLKGPDGEVDPERVNQMRTQFCSAPVPGQGEGPQGQGAGRGGPAVVFAPGGPPPGGPGGGPRGPGGGPRGPGGGGFVGPGGGGSPDGRGRWFFNLNYSYQFENEVLVAPGGPLLDLLDGGATG